jgi:ABC transporter substrate binding protein (PQQ-dependent alcohol dehydrogenase system)
MTGVWARIVAVVALLLASVPPSAAQTAATPPQEIRIGYMHIEERGRITLSVLDMPPADDGLAGAIVGINDNNTTGRFLGQKFLLEDVVLKAGEDPLPAVDRLLADGAQFIVADLPAADLLKVADHVKGRDVLVFNVGALDDSLREENCRANVIHTAPTRSMLADGLAQYLAWKQWRNWFLVEGANPNDQLMAAAIRRAAERFGATIVAEKTFADTGGARQTDSGHAQVQKQIPVFTQDAPDYDVLIAADESEVFGTYLPYRTWLPRPVAGSAGLIPSSWHPAFEGWGAAQIQNRFQKASKRRMRDKDMQAWIAVRMIGEAATRTKSIEEKVIETFIKAPDFSIAAFKGQRVTLRDWNWQLRQPVLLADRAGVVSISPQEGFLHQFSELDTLGVDRPETACVLK